MPEDKEESDLMKQIEILIYSYMQDEANSDYTLARYICGCLKNYNNIAFQNTLAAFGAEWRNKLASGYSSHF